jgi:hypothetical protein
MDIDLTVVEQSRNIAKEVADSISVLCKNCELKQFVWFIIFMCCI